MDRRFTVEVQLKGSGLGRAGAGEWVVVKEPAAGSVIWLWEEVTDYVEARPTETFRVCELVVLELLDFGSLGLTYQDEADGPSQNARKPIMVDGKPAEWRHYCHAVAPDYMGDGSDVIVFCDPDFERHERGTIPHTNTNLDAVDCPECVKLIAEYKAEQAQAAASAHEERMGGMGVGEFGGGVVGAPVITGRPPAVDLGTVSLSEFAAHAEEDCKAQLAEDAEREAHRDEVEAVKRGDHADAAKAHARRWAALGVKDAARRGYENGIDDGKYGGGELRQLIDDPLTAAIRAAVSTAIEYHYEDERMTDGGISALGLEETLREEFTTQGVSTLLVWPFAIAAGQWPDDLLAWANGEMDAPDAPEEEPPIMHYATADGKVICIAEGSDGTGRTRSLIGVTCHKCVEAIEDRLRQITEDALKAKVDAMPVGPPIIHYYDAAYTGPPTSYTHPCGEKLTAARLITSKWDGVTCPACLRWMQTLTEG